MIPRVKQWAFTDKVTGIKYRLLAPTKKLALISIRLDHPNTWGNRLVGTYQRDYKK